MPSRFPALDAILRQIEADAAETPDPVGAVALLVRLVLDKEEVDPYLLAGVLIEGIATTLSERIPAEKRGEVAVEIMRLLRDRLSTWGLI